MYSVESGAEDLEQLRESQMIAEALAAAQGAVEASMRTVKDIDQANEDEVFEALIVA